MRRVLLVKRDWAKAKRQAAASIARANAALKARRTYPDSLLKVHGGDCTRCGKATVRRFRRSDNKPFYGCVGYPRCTGTWSPPLA